MPTERDETPQTRQSAKLLTFFNGLSLEDIQPLRDF